MNIPSKKRIRFFIYGAIIKIAIFRNISYYIKTNYAMGIIMKLSMIKSGDYTAITYTNNIEMQKEKVSQAINNCPTYMAIPELLRNACQAKNVKNIHLLKRLYTIITDDKETISKAREKNYKCDPIGILSNEYKITIPKLAIRNDGDGIDDEKLLRITNLGQTEDKEFGKYNSFGVGGKVGGLSYSPCGVQYICHHDGSYNSVLLAGIKSKNNTFFGRIKNPDQLDDNNVAMDIWDATRLVNDLNQSEYLSKIKCKTRIGLLEDENDWTEVILLGNHILEDTTKMIDRPKKQEYWVVNNIVDRFFSIRNKECSIFIDNALMGEDDGTFNRLETISENTNYKNNTIIDIDDGIKLHFIHNPDKIDNFANDSSSIFAVVFRGEMYHVERYGNYAIGRKWGSYCTNFNIPNRVANEVSLLIELPDDYKVINDEYRTTLMLDDPNNEDKLQFDPKTLSDAVQDNFPEWLSMLADSFLMTDDEKSLTSYANEEIKKIVDELRTVTDDVIESKNGKLDGVPTSNPAILDEYRASKSRTGNGNPSSGIKGKPDIGSYLDTTNTNETAPRIKGKAKKKEIAIIDCVVLVDIDQISSVGLTNNIARFENNTITINGLCPQIDTVINDTVKEYYNTIYDIVSIENIVRHCAIRTIISQIIRYVYTSKKNSVNMDFRDLYTHIISPPAMSNYIESLAQALVIATQTRAGANHNHEIKRLKMESKRHKNTNTAASAAA